MKRSIFFLILIAITCLGHTKPITEQEAIQIAKNFFFNNATYQTKAFSKRTIAPKFTIAYICQDEEKTLTRTATAKNYYYAINLDNNSGYIIVSADDRAQQILAYSHESNFNPDNLPANCANWLKGYKQEISQLINTPEISVTKSPINKTITYPSVVVEPMTQTLWGQGEPYNSQCPMDQINSINKRSVVGCVAVAMAQVMYHHKWPEKATGTIEYQDSKQNILRTINFDERAPFDWNNMKLAYAANGNTEEEINAIANLMVSTGYACKTTYASTTSSSYTKEAALGLLNYFNYDNGIRYYESGLMSMDEWVDILLNELNESRPVLYSGTNDKSGHAFVCDGYDGKGMFHFNWGWTGSSNGYFALSSLNPSDQDIGGSKDGSYTFNQSMITSIQRPTSGSNPQKSEIITTYLSTIHNGKYYVDESMEIPRTENFHIGFYINNIGLTEIKGETNIGIIQDGQIKLLSTDQPYSLEANNSRWTSHSPNIKDLPTGEYEVYEVYKNDGDEKWSVIKTYLSQAYSYIMTITENTVKMEKAFPNFSIALNGDFNPGATYSNVLKIWNINITNNSDVRLSGKVGIQLRKKGESSSSGSLYTALAYCDPSENTSVKVSTNMNIGEGDFIVTPFYCNDNSITGTVNFKNITPLCEGIPIKTTKKPMIFIDSAIKNYTLDKKDNLIKVSITQPSSKIPWENGRVYAKIFKKEENKDIDTNCYLYSDPFTMNIAFQTKIVDLKGESIDLPTGNNYKITFYMDDGNESVIGSADLSIIQTVTSIANDFMANLNICFNQGSSKLIITSESPLYKLDITNISGNIIQVVQLNGLHNAELQANNLTSGIYLIRIQTDKKTITKKIIIP